MNGKYTQAICAAIAILACGKAEAGYKADIVVMTQNQYLGADLAPIIEADAAPTANAAMIAALITLSNNNFSERVEALADSILDKKPHLVALQEVYAFDCYDPTPLDRCGLFPNAFNDHLAATLSELGGRYYVAAVVQNITLAPPVLPVPGIPLYLDPSAPPVFISVIDRDIILARSDVATSVVPFDCMGKDSFEGCNYFSVAPASVGPFAFNIERGFVGVDATIGDHDYRFVNTHLEVESFADGLFQTAQALELRAVLGQLAQALGPLPEVVVGDFNSDEDDVPCMTALCAMFGVAGLTPYLVLSNPNLDRVNPAFGSALVDAWNLRRDSRPGNGDTCCYDSLAQDDAAGITRRVDLVWVRGTSTSGVTVELTGDEPKRQTAGGLYGSDHLGVSARMTLIPGR